jgi:two-component system, LytTR family, response regulator
MIKAVIIDDEEISMRALGEKIKKHCPDLEILKLFSKPIEALKEIEELRPDVVYLDIEMPQMNGFSFLKNCNPVSFEVIFTTAYSEYAIEALRISALDFLLKPIDTTQLVSATNRLKERLKNKVVYQGFLEQQIQLFFQYNQRSAQIGRIALPVVNGLEFIQVNDVIKIKGENVYSIFFLVDGKKMVTSLTLKETEAMLVKFGFFRVHKSYMVNLKYVAKYIKGEGGVVVMKDGSEVEVSRRNKPDFLKRISG